MNIVNLLTTVFVVFASFEGLTLFAARKQIARRFHRKIKRTTTKTIYGIPVTFHKGCLVKDVKTVKETISRLPESIPVLFSDRNATIDVLPQKDYIQRSSNHQGTAGIYILKTSHIDIAAGPQLKEVLWHEFGHFVDHYCALFYGRGCDFTSQRFSVLASYLGSMPRFYRARIDKYYRENVYEFFAFSFSCYMQNKPERVPPAMLRLVEHLIDDADYASIYVKRNKKPLKIPA